MTKHTVVTINPYIELLEANDYREPSYFVVNSVALDGVVLEDYAVDIYNMLNMIQDSYDYGHSFWTCGCGNRGCAGIEDMVLNNSHQNENLNFTLYQPISVYQVRTNPHEDYDELYDKWMSVRTEKNIIVNKSQLIQALHTWIEAVKTLDLPKDRAFQGYNNGYSYDDENINILLSEVEEFLSKI